MINTKIKKILLIFFFPKIFRKCGIFIPPENSRKTPNEKKNKVNSLLLVLKIINTKKLIIKK